MNKTLVRYNLELSLDDILLVEKYNGTVPALFFDPIYAHVLKCYFKLLGKDNNNTFEISDEEYMNNVLSSDKSSTEVTSIFLMSGDNPVEFIRQAINYVCDAIPLYRTFK